MAKYSSNSLSKFKDVHPSLILVMMEAINDTPIDFSIIAGVRTTETQKGLYAQGRTTKGAIVTYADGVKNKSNHQKKADGYGHAIDFCPYVNGKLDWNNHDNFRTIVNHIKATAQRLGVKITCGIDWKKPYDPPHIQLG